MNSLQNVNDTASEITEYHAKKAKHHLKLMFHSALCEAKEAFIYTCSLTVAAAIALLLIWSVAFVCTLSVFSLLPFIEWNQLIEASAVAATFGVFCSILGAGW